MCISLGRNFSRPYDSERNDALLPILSTLLSLADSVDFSVIFTLSAIFFLNPSLGTKAFVYTYMYIHTPFGVFLLLSPESFFTVGIRDA